LVANFVGKQLVIRLLAENVTVKLVRFHVDRWNIADSSIMESGALLANGFKDVQDGFLFQSSVMV